MSNTISIRKGLNIRLVGESTKEIKDIPSSSTVCLSPLDFHGLIPKMVVKEGESVQVGDTVFQDKKNEKIKFVSPTSGTIKQIVRAEKRKIVQIIIESDSKHSCKKFNVKKIADTSKEEMLDILLESGIWPSFKQRPLDVIADPSNEPKGIFISSFDSSPLAPDYSFILKEKMEQVQMGLNALNQLANGKVHLSSRKNSEFTKMQNVIHHNIDGVHPAGNIGTQIHHIDPMNKGEFAWSINIQDVAAIGRLFETGSVDGKKCIAVGGSEIKNPDYKNRNTCAGLLLNVLTKVLWYYNDNLNDMENVNIDGLYYSTLDEDGKPILNNNKVVLKCLRLPLLSNLPLTTQPGDKPHAPYDTIKYMAVNNDVLFAVGCYETTQVIYYCKLTDGIPETNDASNWKTTQIGNVMVENIKDIFINDNYLFIISLTNDDNYKPIYKIHYNKIEFYSNNILISDFNELSLLSSSYTSPKFYFNNNILYIYDIDFSSRQINLKYIDITDLTQPLTIKKITFSNEEYTLPDNLMKYQNLLITSNNAKYSILELYDDTMEMPFIKDFRLYTLLKLYDFKGKIIVSLCLISIISFNNNLQTHFYILFPYTFGSIYLLYAFRFRITTFFKKTKGLISIAIYNIKTGFNLYLTNSLLVIFPLMDKVVFSNLILIENYGNYLFSYSLSSLHILVQSQITNKYYRTLLSQNISENRKKTNLILISLVGHIMLFSIILFIINLNVFQSFYSNYLYINQYTLYSL